jgi:hypothetical protein
VAQEELRFLVEETKSDEGFVVRILKEEGASISSLPEAG